jgi:hypothetical protein
VVGNTLFGNAACGLHMNGDISQGGTGVITDALIEKNFVHDNGATAGGSGSFTARTRPGPAFRERCRHRTREPDTSPRPGP